MQVVPITPDKLVDEIVEEVLRRPGRVRLGVDGPPPTDPSGLAGRVAERLRGLGRAALAVAADDFLRPASVRLEFGRRDPDEFLDSWLDESGLRREVLDPMADGGSGRVLPRLWDATADRAYRVRYAELPGDGVVALGGGLLLGRGLPFDLTVHLRMGTAALRRTLPAPDHWTLPAWDRYEEERNPAGDADILVLSDHPDRPALRTG